MYLGTQPVALGELMNVCVLCSSGEPRRGVEGDSVHGGS